MTNVRFQEKIRVYDNRLEVWNRGELPQGYTEETLMGSHSSKPRNRNIANAMFKAGFIDTWGRGYMKIRDGFEMNTNFAASFISKLQYNHKKSIYLSSVIDIWTLYVSGFAILICSEVIE